MNRRTGKQKRTDRARVQDPMDGHSKAADKPTDYDEKEVTIQRIARGRGPVLHKRRRREAQNKRSKKGEELFRSLFESSFNAIMLTIPEKARVLAANPAACSLLQATEQEILKTPRDQIIAIQNEALTQALQECERTGRWRGEVTFRRKDGSTFPAELEVSTVMTMADGTAMTGLIFRDITERKRAEKALQDREARYRRIVATVPGVIYDYIIYPDGSSRFLYLSPLCLDMFEIEWDVLMRDPNLFLKLVHPDDINRLIEEQQDARRECRYVESEVRIVTPSGLLKWIRLTSRPNRAGRSSKESVIWSGLVQDITERKRMKEEILRSREELRRLAGHLSTIREDEKAKIARELHDELGQSLTAVSYDLHWLRKKLRKDQSAQIEKVDSLIAITKGTVETIKRIQGELRPWMLDTLGLCETMDWQAKQFSERTHIPVAFEWNDETAIDQEMSVAIFRIFQEALTNAARHAQATMIRVELRKDDTEVKLIVGDNGRGIEQHELCKPLSFGLLGMKERVEAFGGSLTVEGSPGKGTVLTIRIPV